jgi:hypothetical protein
LRWHLEEYKPVVRQFPSRKDVDTEAEEAMALIAIIR